MTDKQIVETLKNIKEHCKKNIQYGECACVFNNYGQCLLKQVAFNLENEYPRKWNIESIEELIKQ